MKNSIETIYSALVAILITVSTLSCASAGIIEVKSNQLFIDGKAQPQLFGAELQYFRLRGGLGRNVPREKVIALWNAALDRMVEAHMNAISFYIPWDFHEYAEGKFDFTGTVDEDGDGRPDYPSRDIVTFFKLVADHGIHHIMVRPGPYINAEWGFLGFGAIPLWFHEKFPESHMQNAEGLRTKLYDYHNPKLLEYTQKWFDAVYKQVLAPNIGPGKPISFLQIDNETNFMWQSIHNHDFNPSAIKRYQSFLKDQYKNLTDLNRAQKTEVSRWEDIQAPRVKGQSITQDQDWYRFQDESIHSYLIKIRRFWEQLGIKEPQVLFTLAESYNAANDGLLPNFKLRNDPQNTGLQTVNLYPKTYESPLHPLLNQPFKSDHDVKAVTSASENYWGRKEEWALGPEIQGGWWKGTPVLASARKQTYLSTIGHGLKALFVYYFNEGENWQTDWQREQVKPLYEELKVKMGFEKTPMNSQTHSGENYKEQSTKES